MVKVAHDEETENVENSRNDRENSVRREGDAYILPQRLNAVEQEQIAARQRDEEYRKRQLAYENRQVWLTGGLVLLGLITMGISIWQSIIARRSAEAAETAGRAAEVAARAAENQLPLQLGQLDIAREQMTSASKFGTAQLESQREAIRLDQRAWLGLSGYALQARTPNAREPAEWQLREPQMGDEFRFRFELTNNGRTPALNVATVVSSMQILLQGYPPPREPDWANAKFPETPKTTVFPNDSGRYHFAGNFRIDEKFPYTIYRSGKGTMFIWARTYYCDTSRRLHWHQVCVSHIFGTNSPGDFGICASEVSPEPGETGHPRCH